ncbi:MAG: hypothetical protein B7Z55_13425, partial [Planctomycetales bacterium 12-60-4]
MLPLRAAEQQTTANFGGAPVWVIARLSLLSVVVLTLTRSMFIIVGLVAMLQPALSKGKGIGRVIVLAVLLGVGATVGLQYMPGSERITKRYDTMKD